MSDPLRFFVSPESLEGDSVVITDEVHHHLRNVLRVKTGSSAMLLDGTGTCCNVEITEIDARQTTAHVTSRWQQPHQGLTITLLQSLPKGDKFDLVLQKGTELGVRIFQPLTTEHTVTSLTGNRLSKREQRWQRIISEAARQSRHVILPELKPLQPLSSVLEESGDALKLVLWEAGAMALAKALPSSPPKEVMLLIGPEGGFSEAEMANITEAGFQPVHLGPRILRTETAGLAATPILQYLYGDWLQAPTEQN